jgi:hypothetical protein
MSLRQVLVEYKKEPTVTSAESRVTGITTPEIPEIQESKSFDANANIAIANTSHSLEKYSEDNLI